MNKNKIDFKIGAWVFMVLGGLLLVSLIFNFSILKTTNRSLDKKIAEVEEAARPAKLKLTILTPAGCNDCFDMRPIIDGIKSKNVEIEEKWIGDKDKDGQALITKYSIATLPSLIVEGEVEKDESLKKIWPTLGEIKDGVFILRKPLPPYKIISTGEIKGRLEITMITDQSCQDCYDIALHTKILSSIGIPTSNKKNIDINSEEGKSLISKYSINLVPTIIIKGDMNEYSDLKGIWSKIGTVEEDGSYVFREGVNGMGTYKNLATGEIIKFGNK